MLLIAAPSAAIAAQEPQIETLQESELPAWFRTFQESYEPTLGIPYDVDGDNVADYLFQGYWRPAIDGVPEETHKNVHALHPLSADGIIHDAIFAVYYHVTQTAFTTQEIVFRHDGQIKRYTPSENGKWAVGKETREDSSAVDVILIINGTRFILVDSDKSLELTLEITLEILGK